MNAQVDQFIRELHLSSESKKFLEERCISLTDQKIFDIGFCPPSSGFSFDFLNGRVIVPIYDSYNNLVAFAGRKVEAYSNFVMNYYKYKYDDLQGLERFMKWKTSKWINTPYNKKDHLFNLNRAKKSIFNNNFCFIVEGYFDVIHLNNLGFDNVVALCGTALSERHCDLLFRYCKNIVLLFDGDQAGQTASYNSMLKARKNHLFTHVVELENNTDPDNLSTGELNFIKDQVTNTSEELYIKLSTTPPMKGGA
jgi:DNA primase